MVVVQLRAGSVAVLDVVSPLCRTTLDLSYGYTAMLRSVYVPTNLTRPPKQDSPSTYCKDGHKQADCAAQKKQCLIYCISQAREQ